MRFVNADRYLGHCRDRGLILDNGCIIFHDKNLLLNLVYESKLVLHLKLTSQVSSRR
jgi:hypothetical protein